MPTQKKCEQCGNDFISTNKQAKYCSRACKGIASQKYRYEHTCPECQNTFTVTTGVDKIYCSNRCAGFAKAKVRKSTEWKARVNLECAYCKKPFSKPPSQIERAGRGQYCSKVCSDAAKVGVVSKKRRFATYTCKTCGNQWDAPHRLSHRKKYCSRVCRSIGVIQSMTHERTSIERETYAALSTIGLDFEPQFRIGYKVVDAFIPSLNTIIECLGDYFHCNPDVYPDGPINPMQIRNTTDDKRRFSTFKTKGYTVIKLWEKDIKEHGALKLLSKLLPTI